MVTPLDSGLVLDWTPAHLLNQHHSESLCDSHPQEATWLPQPDEWLSEEDLEEAGK